MPDDQWPGKTSYGQSIDHEPWDLDFGEALNVPGWCLYGPADFQGNDGSSKAPPTIPETSNGLVADVKSKRCHSTSNMMLVKPSKFQQTCFATRDIDQDTGILLEKSLVWRTKGARKRKTWNRNPQKIDEKESFLVKVFGALPCLTFLGCRFHQGI